MIPIFIAFQNAAGATSHALLPQASPHATTHLPDSYIDSIDLTVFRNDTHSIARLRTFGNYVTLSAVPGASSNVYIYLPAGEQIQLPISTHNDTTWFILLDDAQFAYADLRCSIEFDYDHSISNSMRPPEVPRPPEHVSIFEDNEMISETLHPTPITCDDSGFAEALNMGSAKVDSKLTKASRSSLASQVVIIPTVPEIEPTRENIHQSCRSDLVHKPMPSHEHNPGHPSQVLQPINTNVNRCTSRQPGEESQILQPTETTTNRRTSRQSGKESQVLDPARRYPRFHRNAGEESQILIASNLKNTSRLTRQPGEQSQILQEKTATISERNPLKTSLVLEKMQVRNTALVNHNLNQDLNVFDTSVPSHRIHASIETITNTQRPPLSRSQRDPTSLDSLQYSAFGSAQINGMSKSHLLKLHQLESPDMLHPSIPRKRTFSELSNITSQPSPSKSRTRTKSSPLLSDTESSSTDVSTTSTVTVNVPPRRKNKRRRSLRRETDSIDIPAKPVLVFSTNCTVQNKKRTMDTFYKLGGAVANDICDANLLCVPANDGIRKTPKLILAVILGKIIVTENWVVQCARTGRFPPAGEYQPSDKLREREWGVKLPDALNQALFTDTKLDQLFAGYRFYLTQSLQDQLSKTGNLEAFVKIGTSMGAEAVRKRLPVRFGPRLIVLGIEGDYDAVTTGKLGLPLYDKDLLTMSALRGRNEADKDDFRIEAPIKEEELSQS